MHVRIFALEIHTYMYTLGTVILVARRKLQLSDPVWICISPKQLTNASCSLPLVVLTCDILR